MVIQDIQIYSRRARRYASPKQRNALSFVDISSFTGAYVRHKPALNAIHAGHASLSVLIQNRRVALRLSLDVCWPKPKYRACALHEILPSIPPPNYERDPGPDPFTENAWGEVEQNRQVNQTWYRKHRICIVVIALFSFVMIGSWALAASAQNRNFEQWEKDLASKKAQEKVRELEWESQMAQKQEQERTREIEWDHQMQKTRDQERIREDDWERQMEERKAQEQVREIEWEHQMEEAHEQERVRERDWEHQMAERCKQEHLREMEWERQMEEKLEDERVRERQWHLDQAGRERLGLYWAQPTAGRCSSHGVRDYSAQLLNAAPYHYNWLEPCMDIPIIIEGMPHNASRCEQNGDEIWGHWSMEGDSLCSPFFEDWRDNGCIAPGSQLRRASARLDYVPSGENGMELCNSTPFKFWDRSFAHPSTCVQHPDNIWGYWLVDDGDC
ncbi:hypothetical protein HWV62_18542 [Athelia sp. TMB]|nr:hypothetical protein HWV62_18542 [Athelia sp. TMB]